MNRRNVVYLSVMTALGLAVLPANTIAQQADVEGVKAAPRGLVGRYSRGELK